VSDDWSLKDYSNPCMKCGSVECAVCSEDIDILRQKLIDDMVSFLCNKLVYTDALATYETNKKEITNMVNKRFGVD